MNNNLLSIIKQKQEKAKKTKAPKANSCEKLVQKYAQDKKCIITAKIYGTKLHYDFQLAQNIKNGAKNDLLVALYGAKKAQDIVKSQKAYNAQNTDEKRKNQGGKSTLLPSYMQDLQELQKYAQELQENNIYIASDIIEKQAQKLAQKLEKIAQKENAKAPKEKAKTSAK